MTWIEYKHIIYLVFLIVLFVSIFRNRKKDAPSETNMENHDETSAGQIPKTLEQQVSDRSRERVLFRHDIPIVLDIPFGVVVLVNSGVPIYVHSPTYKSIVPPETETLGEIRDMGALRNISVAEWAEPLTQRYGDNKFMGYFFPNLPQTTVANGVAVTDPLSAEEALRHALHSSTGHSRGYLAIAVQGNQYRPKDVLIMDLSNRRWLSLNQSMGKALARYYDALLQETIMHGPPLDESGLLISGHYMLEQPVMMSVTDNNLVQHAIDIRTTPGQELLAIALEETDLPYFLAYSVHEHKVRYAMDKNSPLLDSMDEVDLYRDALEAGLEVEVKDHHPILHFKQDFVPNVLLEVNGNRMAAGGQAVSENIPSTEADLAFAKDVVKLSLSKQGQTVVVRRPLPMDNYQEGQISHYIVTM